MPKVEHIKRSHGASEYVITLTEDEMREFHSELEHIQLTVMANDMSLEPIWPALANALHLLDPYDMPTPFN